MITTGKKIHENYFYCSLWPMFIILDNDKFQLEVGKTKTKIGQSKLSDPIHIIHTVWGLCIQDNCTWAWHSQIFFSFSSHSLWPQGLA